MHLNSEPVRYSKQRDFLPRPALCASEMAYNLEPKPTIPAAGEQRRQRQDLVAYQSPSLCPQKTVILTGTIEGLYAPQLSPCIFKPLP
jgi:hypothetical protein